MHPTWPLSCSFDEHTNDYRSVSTYSNHSPIKVRLVCYAGPIRTKASVDSRPKGQDPKRRMFVIPVAFYSSSSFVKGLHRTNPKSMCSHRQKTYVAHLVCQQARNKPVSNWGEKNSPIGFVVPIFLQPNGLTIHFNQFIGFVKFILV